MEKKNIVTIADAQKYIVDNGEDGVVCPCCNRRIQIYKRYITSAMAAGLIRIYFVSGRKSGDFYHINDFDGYKVGDFAKLRHWLLIEGGTNDDITKKNSGFWKITERGVDFVERKIVLPKHLKFCKGEYLGVVDQNNLVGIKDCLRNKFNYNDLMNGTVL